MKFFYESSMLQFVNDEFYYKCKGRNISILSRKNEVWNIVGVFINPR